MKRIRAAMSILTLAAASSLMADAIAGENCIPKGTEYAPFVIGFMTDGDGSILKAVIYPVDKEMKQLGKPRYENDVLKGALTVKGQRCGHRAIAVNRFWNHDLFYTIEIMPGTYMKIPITH